MSQMNPKKIFYNTAYPSSTTIHWRSLPLNKFCEVSICVGNPVLLLLNFASTSFSPHLMFFPFSILQTSFLCQSIEITRLISCLSIYLSILRDGSTERFLYNNLYLSPRFKNTWLEP